MKKQSKNLVVVTYGYPNVNKPNEYVFLKNLLLELSSYDVQISVIHPITKKQNRMKEKYLAEHKDCRINEEKSNIKVYEPVYNSYDFLFPLRHINTLLIDRSFFDAVDRTLRENGLDSSDTVLYSHFLNAGMCVSELSAKYSMPAFCAVGESKLWSIKYRPGGYVKKRLANIRDFISVSTENKDMLLENNLATADKIHVLPNGIDCSLFYQRDKAESREKLGWSKDDVIGIFVGSFIERKGPQRVADAVGMSEGVKTVYIGKGAQRPQDENALFIGEVNHNEIPVYLSAADFFVLPTLAEGCCNAIVEAMACGLPVISSDGAFNDDILTEDYSVRVNPTDIEAIASAVTGLKNDPEKRGRMSESARKASEKFDVHERAYKIGRIIGIVDD